MAQQHIVVIGSLNLDRTLRVADFPQAGATQSALAYAQGAGGKGANQAAAAARMGASTWMLGCVGDDADGALLAKALADAGVETASVVRTADEPTGSATILLTPAGQNSIVVVPGANAALVPQHLHAHKELLTSAAAILLQLETSLEVLAEAIAIATPAGVPVILDPAPATMLPHETLRGLSWFTPNENEARFYAQASGFALHGEPEAQAEALSHHFQTIGPRNILLKLGEHGAAMLLENGEFFRTSAPAVQVVDTTGAGDTLNGAFAAELVTGSTPQEALRVAVAAASLAATRAGALTSTPTRDEVLGFIGKQGA